MQKTKKVPVLKENHLFLKAYGKGKGFVSDAVAVYVLRNRSHNRSRNINSNKNNNKTFVGFTVSKSRGNAVVRNGIRRRLREAYRVLYPFVKDGYIIVIVARQACVNFNSTELCEQLHATFRKAALLKDPTDKPQQ